MVALETLKLGDTVTVKIDSIDRRTMRQGKVIYIHPEFRYAVVRVKDSFNEAFHAEEIF